MPAVTPVQAVGAPLIKTSKVPEDVWTFSVTVDQTFGDSMPQFVVPLGDVWASRMVVRGHCSRRIRRRPIEVPAPFNVQMKDDPLLGENYQIGHSYFTPRGDNFSALDMDWYHSIVRTEIVPLLKARNIVLQLDEKAKDLLVSKGISRGKISLVRPGIDVTRFSRPNPEQRNIWNKKLKAGSYSIVFSHVATPRCSRRHFEVPAAGALLFEHADRRPTLTMFEDRKECVFYDADNLEALLEHYLEHEEERQRLANASVYQKQTIDAVDLLNNVVAQLSW